MEPFWRGGGPARGLYRHPPTPEVEKPAPPPCVPGAHSPLHRHHRQRFCVYATPPPRPASVPRPSAALKAKAAAPSPPKPKSGRRNVRGRGGPAAADNPVLSVSQVCPPSHMICSGLRSGRGTAPDGPGRRHCLGHDGAIARR